MEDVIKLLCTKYDSAMRTARDADDAAQRYQASVAEARAEAGHARAIAAELARLLHQSYGHVISDDQGRQVVHTGDPEPDTGFELPKAVWVRDADLMRAQVGMASDTRSKPGIGPEYLLQVDMLTPEQKAKYGGEQTP